MRKNLVILGLAGAVILLPFLARERGRPSPPAGAPVLNIISAHNEAARYEFARAFSEWHARVRGTPVEVRWITIGGTTEISRYLEAQYLSGVRAFWKRRGGDWPARGGEAVLDGGFVARGFPEPARAAGESDAAYGARRARAEREWGEIARIHQTYRATDDPSALTCKADLLFGGGVYDHQRASSSGYTVPAWPEGREPVGLFARADGMVLIPRESGGELWRGAAFYGCAVSTFGIFYNTDRLKDLGVSRPPATWDDLSDPAYYRALGVTDPTKSGSIAKAFEMIVQQKMAQAVARAGFSPAQIEIFEAAPASAPPAYEAALEAGWADGVRLIRLIGANARYFTDSSTKAPVDVSAGAAAAGIGIDFTARYQAELSPGRDGRPRMVFLTPAGGSSVSADPISLLRGAEHRELAVSFIEFVLGPEGQRLWTYRPGVPGGPHRFALRRLPIRRDFYPSADPAFQAAHLAHRPRAADDLASPAVNPYALADQFVYRPRWTVRHFGVLRDLVRAMCLDSMEELQGAWSAINRNGGPALQPRAMELLNRMPGRPEPLRWGAIADEAGRRDRLELMREWTAFFRASYAEAASAVESR